MTKIFLRVLMNKSRTEVSSTEYSFVEDNSARNGVFIACMIIELAIEIQRTIIYISLTRRKLSIKKNTKTAIDLLELLDVDGKDL